MLVVGEVVMILLCGYGYFDQHGTTSHSRRLPCADEMVFGTNLRMNMTVGRSVYARIWWGLSSDVTARMTSMAVAALKAFLNMKCLESV